MELTRCLGIEADECARCLVVEELHDDALIKTLDRTVQRTEVVQPFLIRFGEASPSEFLDDLLDLFFSIFRLDVVSQIQYLVRVLCVVADGSQIVPCSLFEEASQITGEGDGTS